jgi:phospholipid/cholesterol/gamma-HCH transport system substrate-binding protein
MRRNWAAFTVGILVLVAFSATFGLFRYITERTAGKGYKVSALFTDAIGLQKKTRVMTAGLPVGTILDRKLEPQAAKARIFIEIDKDVVIYSNAVVFKKSASLLGEFYLEIDPGSEITFKTGQRNRILGDGDEIKQVVEGQTIAQVTDQVGQTIPILRSILEDVQTLTSGPIKEIAQGVNQSISKNSEVLERLLLRVDRIAANIESITVEESDDIKIAIGNIRDITEGVKKLVGTSEGTVAETGAELKSSLQKIQSSVDKLERTLTNVEKLSSDVAAGEGTVGRLLTDDQIADNIEQITEDAGGFIKGVTGLQTIVGLRSEYAFAANTYKNYISLMLAPRPDKFYLIELVDDPRGFRTDEVRSVVSSRDGYYSERVTNVSEALRFSFQFGKKWGLLTGRFGIIESTGGAGLDLDLFRNRVLLNLDVFDTRANAFPRVRARASLAVLGRSLYLIGGVDDVLNLRPGDAGINSQLDLFAGAQLIFNDQDLKTLLLFGGNAVSGAAGGRR